ncbi:MAG: thiamine diphosphokinase [Clostridia bacterium]|nr:thiamine diphosphokinase [Clostridia bacterium]MBQ4543387.1 thiamine diphosphokinase [Clostridia bacterium]MBQ9997994.1 thiamine diphosphokinase [Clostridia bacterium]
MGRRAFIYAAGDFSYDDLSLYYRIKLNDDDMIICADGGYNLATEVGVTPDVVIGDMDSVSGNVPENVKTYRYPCKKDKTDLHICVDFALQNGCDEIILLGALGKRLSHTLGAIMLLEYIHNNGATGVIFTSNTKIMLVSDTAIIKKDNYDSLTIIPLTCIAEGVTTTGLKYPLNDHDMTRQDNLGISNEFENDVATISVKKGLLVVILENLLGF